ncbi:MAG: uroporphyrinogen decarboxylase [Geminicoccaceae bacterium]|nr:uroporphyrinogen decarboxylase [Geminicoccaceae bacterium]HRY25672.1 uroporphyrinogen decarboxylase [Geminicoccaceae bacterium]
MSTDSPKRLLRVLRGEPVDRAPVWLMRQAGRYLPEYRALRRKTGGFLELCYDPVLAEEVTLQPIRRFDLDAAILFSDILVVPDALGADVGFHEGEGPRLTPLAHRSDLGRLSTERLHEHLEPVYETLRRLRRSLPGEVTLIGFAGAPWTLAAYMVEGGGSKDWAVARRLARVEPRLFGDLVDLLTKAVIAFLERQVAAGAEVLQVFDSWAGALPPDERERWVTAPLARIVAELGERCPGVPVIVFARGVGPALVDLAAAIRPAGLGIDTTIDPAWAAASLPGEFCLQGNLDPIALVAGGDTMRRAADRILAAWRERSFIFNLGHGVVPETPPENVLDLVRHLKSGSD